MECRTCQSASQGSELQSDFGHVGLLADGGVLVCLKSHHDRVGDIPFEEFYEFIQFLKEASHSVKRHLGKNDMRIVHSPRGMHVGMRIY